MTITPYTPFQPSFREFNANQLNDLANLRKLAAYNRLTAHAGGGRTNATKLGYGINVIATCATSGDSVVVPPARQGTIIIVANDGASNLQVFAQGSDTIGGVVGSTGISIAPGGANIYACGVDATWDLIGGGAGSFTGSSITNGTLAGTLNLNATSGITIGGDLFWNRNYGTAPSGTSINNRYLTTLIGNADGTSDVRGFLIDIDARGTNDIALVEGLNVGAFVNTTAGTTGTAVTFRSTCTLADVDPIPPIDGGILTTALVYEGHIANEGSQTITNAYVFHAAGIDLGQSGVTGTATNAYAFHAGDQGGERTPGLVTNRACAFVSEDFTGGANITAAFYSEMSSGTGKWNLYLSGSADSAIAGNLRIGSTVAPTADLDVTGNVKFGNGTFFTGTSATQNTTFASDGTFTTTRSNNSVANVINLVNNGVTAGGSTQGLAVNFGLTTGGGTPGNAANGGRIRSLAEGDYSTGAASDASLVFDVGVDNAPSTSLTLFSDKHIETIGAIKLFAGSAIPAGGSTGRGLQFTTATNFGVFIGSGAPTLSAAQGSLYLRSDGTTTNDRAYINTNGTTGWTALTTAA